MEDNVLDKAIQKYSEGTKLYPRNSDMHYALAEAFYKSGDYYSAIKSAKPSAQMAKKAGMQSNAYNLQGLAHQALCSSEFDAFERFAAFS